MDRRSAALCAFVRRSSSRKSPMIARVIGKRKLTGASMVAGVAPVMTKPEALTSEGAAGCSNCSWKSAPAAKQSAVCSATRSALLTKLKAPNQSGRSARRKPA
jgi:hypothetical protein